MKDRDLYWLAGIVEGEGCFDAPKGKPRLQIAMNDGDILHRVKAIIEAGSVMGPYPYKNHPEWEDRMQYQVVGQAAAEIMAILLPIMGIRRQKKIRWVMENANARIVWP
jgi:hypothetical protein